MLPDVIKSTWNHVTFVELFKHSPKQAFEYRFRCLGEPIPAEYAEKTPENDENANKGTVEESSDTLGGTDTEKPKKRAKKTAENVE